MNENEDKDELRWHDLRTELPKESTKIVILFPRIIDVGILYNVNPYRESNSEYARQNALREGYTSWFPVLPHPDEEKVEKEIEKLYEKEYDSKEQFDKGFERATENIIEFLKDIVPDRPHVILAVQSRFENKYKEE